MWQRMVNQQYRLLSALDRWIEQLERAHEDRTAAGIKAGEAVRAQADQALLASIGAVRTARRLAHGGRDDDADVTRPAGWSPTAAGIALADAARAAARVSDRLDPVERVALASRVRTRAGPARRPLVAGRTSGPLVGHRAASGAPVALLWRRGGYEAVNPVDRPRDAGSTKANADEFEPRAVMFYRPLPGTAADAARGCSASACAAPAPTCATWCSAGWSTVALGALVPIATGKVLGEYVPQAPRPA